MLLKVLKRDTHSCGKRCEQRFRREESAWHIATSWQVANSVVSLPITSTGQRLWRVIADMDTGGSPPQVARPTTRPVTAPRVLWRVESP